MITNFEGITESITDFEKKLIPYIIEGLSKRDKQNPIKAPEIVDRLNKFIKNMYPYEKYTFTESRLRKMCNMIRSNGILPLIATPKGYYTSTDELEIRKQIKSLEDRADAILNSANGLKKFIKYQ
jgi:hypothetical protein